MPDPIVLVADLIGITALVAAYYGRYRRRDMVLAFAGLNVAVLAVANVLTTSTGVGVGAGLGLFGVLSIIRLRSSELSQQDVAYYFAALAIGLLAGLDPSPTWIAPASIAAIVAVMVLTDHPSLHRTYRHQRVVLDAAVTDERDLIGRLELMFDARVLRAVAIETDLVRDLTVVEVRYVTRSPSRSMDAESHSATGSLTLGAAR